MKAFILRVLVCIFFFGFALYSYVDKQNELTELKLRLPRIAKEIKAIRQENMRLAFEIESFENPEHLMELAKEFGHLKHPCLNEIVMVKEGIALQSEPASDTVSSDAKTKVSFAVGPN
jgi:hypothetical protein